MHYIFFQATEVLKRIATINGKEDIEFRLSSTISVDNTRGKFMEAFKGKYFVTTIVFGICGFCVAFLFYGVSMTTPNFFDESILSTI